MTTLGDPSQSGRYFIGRYEVVSRLNEGDLADAWLCREHTGYGLPRLVLIRSLKPHLIHDPDCRAMFIDEGRLGEILDHPHIARVEETGEFAGLPYLVQEHIEGPSVQQLLRRQRRIGLLDLRLAVRVGLDIARALHHAHTATDPRGNPLEVVHRDVSPDNILVSNEGRAVLIGFGVARFEGQAARIQTNALKGRLRLMAPETILRNTLNVQTDLYGLGVVLHVLCVGQHAWAGEAIGERLSSSIPRPSLHRADLPQDLEEILMKLLEREPSRRHRTAAELVGALSAWLDRYGPVSDAELAERIGALFPEGPTYWRSLHNTATYGALAPPRTLAPPTPPDRAWLPLLALGGIGIIALGILPLTFGLLAVALTLPEAGAPTQPTASTAQALRLDPAAVAGLLDAAGVALEQGDLEAASAHLDDLSLLRNPDPALQQRQEQLEASLHVQTRIRSIEILLELDPASALAQARSLDDEFPGEAALAQLIARAEATLQGAPPRPRPPRPARPQPTRAEARPLLTERVTAPAPAPSAAIATKPASRQIRAPDFQSAPAPRLRDPFATPSESAP